jgi:type II secretory pathway pseudopilin PulG
MIGILTSIALPQYQKAVEKSRATAAMAYAEAWVTGQELYYMANGVFAQGRAIGDKRLPSDKFDISLPDELKDFIVYDETPENASGTELRLYRKAENDPGRWDLVSPYRLEVIISVYDDGKFTIYRRCSSNRINPFCKAISNGVNCANAPEAPWCRW